MREFAAICADNHVGAEIRNDRLLGREMFDDLASEQEPADDAVAFAKKYGLEGDVEALGHAGYLIDYCNAAFRRRQFRPL